MRYSSSPTCTTLRASGRLEARAWPRVLATYASAEISRKNLTLQLANWLPRIAARALAVASLQLCLHCNLCMFFRPQYCDAGEPPWLRESLFGKQALDLKRSEHTARRTKTGHKQQCPAQ